MGSVNKMESLLAYFDIVKKVAEQILPNLKGILKMV